jgi:hypothetical protein
MGWFSLTRGTTTFVVAFQHFVTPRKLLRSIFPRPQPSDDEALGGS